MATILIVEDEVFVLQAAEWAVEDMGHSPLMASDLTEALAHLSASGSIDALFVDIRLRALARGGYDVANQAIRIRPDLRVLYTSGTPLNTEMASLFVNGGQFLAKPYTPEDLGTSLGSLLETLGQ
ncbi:response regulator [Caulobacter henricii]|uniref:Histidine kinase n=1 Tax=Caulobacter henricii TaxID=69395 RepID=A0A0P0P0W9_9CAUL|nr:response regulator [Caulobacter henricii]ALL13889.1 histidine kinase [Caulobacter henricii]